MCEGTTADNGLYGEGIVERHRCRAEALIDAISVGVRWQAVAPRPHGPCALTDPATYGMAEATSMRSWGHSRAVAKAACAARTMSVGVSA